MLEGLGVPYVSQGGGAVFKIHLYSYLIIIGFLVVFFNYGLKGIYQSLEGFYWVWFSALSCVFFVITYGLVMHGMSGMAYIINTFLSPLLFIPILASLSGNQKQVMLKVIAYLILINSLLAIIEYLFSFRLVSVEFKEFSFFRSTALLSHPLNNALITASVALIVASRTKIPGFVYVLILSLSLFAFGGRASLGIFIITVFIALLVLIWASIVKGVTGNKQVVAFTMLMVYLSFFCGVFILVESNISERIISKLYIDGSASARVDVFYLLTQLSYSEWVFGASEQLVESIEFYIGIGVIENYLIGWLFTFGLLGSIPLFYSVFCPLSYLFLKGCYLERLSVFSFVVIGVSNNSLTTKTPILLLLFTCLYSSIDLRKGRIEYRN